MTKSRLLAAALAIIAIAVVVARASDRVAVYATVDRVVLEPGADAPDTIQIWGVFALAQPNNPNDYFPAARGYLYYRLPANRDAARREWSDLKGLAGSGQPVAFGSRWESVPRLRQPNDAPANPDVYTLNTGLTKVQGRTDYAPIRSLLEYRGRESRK
jgi:hypothetical protein